VVATAASADGASHLRLFQVYVIEQLHHRSFSRAVMLHYQEGAPGALRRPVVAATVRQPGRPNGAPCCRIFRVRCNCRPDGRQWPTTAAAEVAPPLCCPSATGQKWCTPRDERVRTGCAVCTCCGSVGGLETERPESDIDKVEPQGLDPGVGQSQSVHLLICD